MDIGGKVSGMHCNLRGKSLGGDLGQDRELQICIKCFLVLTFVFGNFAGLAQTYQNGKQVCAQYFRNWNHLCRIDLVCLRSGKLEKVGVLRINSADPRCETEFESLPIRITAGERFWCFDQLGIQRSAFGFRRRC